MNRAWLLLISMCVADGAHAEIREGEQKVALQVVAPLRMPPPAEIEPKNMVVDGGRAYQAIEPSFGALSPLSQVLNADDQVPVGLDLVEGVDSGMAYSVTRSLSLGIRYNFVEAEDLVGDLVVAGTVDEHHQSHHVVFRANWHFQ